MLFILTMNVAIIVSNFEPRVTILVKVVKPTPILGKFLHPVEVAHDS